MSGIGTLRVNMCNCSEVAKFNTEKSIQRQNVFNKNMQPQINGYNSSSRKHLTHKKRSTMKNVQLTKAIQHMKSIQPIQNI